jgi:hypothetical protein
MHLPSPLYDGKYHPSLLGSCILRLFDDVKIEKKTMPSQKMIVIFSTIIDSNVQFVFFGQ